MLKYICSLFLALSLSLGSAQAAVKPSETVILETRAAKERWTEMIVDSMTMEGMQVGVIFIDCGYENAFYYPTFKRVVMCNELVDNVNFGTLRFIVAHEMSHAIIMQKDLPYTGSGEDAADELAAVYLYVNGMQRDILDTALWFYEGSDPAAGDPYDDHTPAYWRAFKLACLYDGATGPEFENEECGDRFLRALRNWDRLLKM